MPITIYPAQPATISGVVNVAAGPAPLTVQLDLAPTDDDGNPYVSLHPDSDPPTGSMQEANRRLLAQIAAATPPMQPPALSVLQVTANGQILGPFPLAGQNAVQVFMYGTYASATLIFEVSHDTLTWLGKRSVRNNGIQDSINGLSLSANSVVANAVDVAGWTYFRVRCSAFGASGTVNVVVAAYGSFTPANVSVSPAGTTAIGAAPSDRPTMIGGIDGGGLGRYFSLDATGQLNVNQGTAGGTPWPVSISGTVPVTGSLTTTPPTQPTVVTQDLNPTDDDGVPYVSLYPDSDPPTGSAQEANRRFLAQLAASVSPPFVFTDVTGVFQVVGDIVGPVSLLGATRITTFVSGTYGAITYGHEVSMDGKLWTGVRSTRVAAIFIDPGTTVAVVANTTQANIADIGGWNYYRARCTAFVSGQTNVVISPSFGPGPVIVNAIVTGSAAEAAAITGFPTRVSGADSGNLTRTLATDTNGQLIVNQGVPGVTPWPVSMPAIPVGSPPENNGNLERLADTMELVLVELRTISVILSQTDQPHTDDVDKLRDDVRLSIQ